MKTLITLFLLFAPFFGAYNSVFAQRKNPTSVEAAEKAIVKQNKKKVKAAHKALKKKKKEYAKMQTKEFRRSLRRNERRHKRQARGLN